MGFFILIVLTIFLLIVNKGRGAEIVENKDECLSGIYSKVVRREKYD